MTRSRAVIAATTLLLAALFVAGGSGAGAASGPSGGCPAHGYVACVDRADGGHRVHLRVGQTLAVALGGATLRWSGLHQTGSDLLRAKGPVVHHDGGIAVSYGAVKSGHMVLQASGAPICSPGKACPQFILLWQVRVVVS
jgi:hypothetical protein